MNYEQRTCFIKHVYDRCIVSFFTEMLTVGSQMPNHKSKTDYFKHADVLFAGFDAYPFRLSRWYKASRLVEMSLSWMEVCFEKSWIPVDFENVSFGSFKAALQLLWGYEISQPRDYTPSDDLSSIIVVTKALEAAKYQGCWDGEITEENYDAMSDFASKALSRSFDKEEPLPLTDPSRIGLKIVDPDDDTKKLLDINMSLDHAEIKSKARTTSKLIEDACNRNINLMRSLCVSHNYSGAIEKIPEILSCLSKLMNENELIEGLEKINESATNISKAIIEKRELINRMKSKDTEEVEMVDVFEKKTGYLKDGEASINNGTHKCITFSKDASDNIIKSGMKYYSLMRSKDKKKLFLVLCIDDRYGNKEINIAPNCRINNTAIVNYICDYFNEKDRIALVKFGEVSIDNENKSFVSIEIVGTAKR